MSKSDSSHSFSQSILVGVLSHSRPHNGQFARARENEAPEKKFTRVANGGRRRSPPITLPTVPFDYKDGEK